MILKNIYKSIACILIWMQFLSGSCFAFENQADFLSPRISVSKDSIKNSLGTYSKAKVEQALKQTAQSIDDIGHRNFKRELSQREMILALAMLLEGKSLRSINDHFDSMNYLLEEFGVKRKPKQIRRIRILRAISVFIFAVGFGTAITMLDIIEQVYHISNLLTLPAFLLVAWFVIGWIVDFFFWIERMIDPRNKYRFKDPVKELNDEERKEFFKQIEQTIRDVVANRFDEETERPYQDAPSGMDHVRDFPVMISPVVMPSPAHALMMSAI